MTLKQFVLHSHRGPGYVEHTEDTDTDSYEGYCIDSVDVRGLDEGLDEEKPRQGVMVFKDAAGSPYTFRIVADHMYPIPDDSYALIGSSDQDSMLNPSLDLWVVGRLNEYRKFEKLSVFRSVDDGLQNLRNLGLKRVKIILH